MKSTSAVGKYNELQDAYKSIYEAFIHAGAVNECKVRVIPIHSERLESGDVVAKLKEMDGILVAPGFGERGIAGKLEAIRYVREHNVPFFGICLPSVVFVIIGAYLTKFIDTRILQIFLAIFLIALSLLFLIFKQLKLKPTASNSVGGGVLSGLAAGLLGTGGAIRGIVLASYNLKMDTFIATSAIIDLAIDFSRSVVYTFNGYVHTHDLYLIPILLVVSVLGTFIGKQILKKMSEEQFKSIVLVLVLFTGVMSLVKVYME